MLWNKTNTYKHWPFEKESHLEDAVNEMKSTLFGNNRIYLDDKKKIGDKGKTNNLPDGYLIDLSDSKEPKLFVVENELASHHHLKHIAVQILEFSLSFESSLLKVKNAIKGMLTSRPGELLKCEKFANEHGFENVDYLLETIINKTNAFNALLIIDELSEELEKVLINRFRFPVETITLKRYKNLKKEVLYEFEPFLNDVAEINEDTDLAEIDTIVVPAREEGFNEVFIGENRWYSIKLNASMIPKIKYIAAYQVKPISAITHIAEVKSIDRWQDTNKYVLTFSIPADEIKHVKMGKNKGKVPQSSRYTSKARILAAKTLDQVFK